MSIDLCVMTGVDEHTSLDELSQLSEEYNKMVEWGFLYSPQRLAFSGRYPSVEFLEHALTKLPAGTKTALHICGAGVTNLLAGEKQERGLLDLIVSRSGRVQLNFSFRRGKVELDALVALLEAFPNTTFITQANSANTDLWQLLAQHGVVNHAVLFDSSGGKGIMPQSWPEPLPIACGYAGGLGARNISIEYPRIASVIGTCSAWIDMESHLRKQDADGVDWIEMNECRSVLQQLRALSGQE